MSILLPQFKVSLLIMAGLMYSISYIAYASEKESIVRRSTTIIGIAWSPDGKELVFSTNRNYEYEKVQSKAFYLWKVGINGKGLKPITQPGKEPKGLTAHYEDSNPQWSPDGTKIIFDSDRGGTRHDDPTRRLRQIFICNADGSMLHQLSSGRGWFDNKQPAWSPDGKQIAWVTNRNASADIMLADSKGKELRYLALTTKLAETFPSWSNDGKTIAFMAQPEWSQEPPPLHIFLRSTSASQPPQTVKPRTLFTYNEQFGLIGTCSPKEDILAFICRNQSSSADISIIHLDGNGLRRVTDLAKQGMSANYLVRPTWSPNGDQIAFVDTTKRHVPEDVYEQGIWICNIADGNVREVPLPAINDTP